MGKKADPTCPESTLGTNLASYDAYFNAYSSSDGRCCAHGRVSSKSAPSRSTSVSQPHFPTIWTEVGRPSVPKADGTAIAGRPVRVKGYWYAVQPCRVKPKFPP